MTLKAVSTGEQADFNSPCIGRKLPPDEEILNEFLKNIFPDIQPDNYEINKNFKDFVNEDIDYSGNDLTGVPDVSLASGIALNFDKFSLFVNHLYIGEMPMNDANSLYSDAYNLLNLKINYSGRLFKSLDYKVNFGVNNLADTKYASSILINATGFNNSEPRYYYPGNPRNYYGGIMLNYHF